MSNWQRLTLGVDASTSTWGVAVLHSTLPAINTGNPDPASLVHRLLWSKALRPRQAQPFQQRLSQLRMLFTTDVMPEIPVLLHQVYGLTRQHIMFAPYDQSIIGSALEMPLNVGRTRSSTERFLVGAAYYAAWDTITLYMKVWSEHLDLEITPSDAATALGLKRGAKKQLRRDALDRILHGENTIWHNTKDTDPQADIADAAAVAFTAARRSYVSSITPEQDTHASAPQAKRARTSRKKSSPAT